MVTACCWLGFGQAQETGAEDGLDEILGGFESNPASETSKSTEQEPSRWNFGGRVSFGSTYNFAHDPPEPGRTDWRGLSMLRLTLELEAAARLGNSWIAFASGHAFNDFVYAVRGRDEYTPQMLDQYENEIELDETYVAGDLGKGFHLRAGRQIVAWGTSETVRVTDVLNPVDLREPGLTDIENLRLPVVMTRFDWVKNRWTLSGMAIHEIRFDKNPVHGSDFYPFDQPLLPDCKPESSLENTEFAFAARGAFHGWDLSLYLADVYDDQPHLELTGPWSVELRHSRLNMAGAAVAATTRDWLFKGEAAHFDGIELFLAPLQTFARTDLMAGFEFFGWNDVSVTFEAVLRHMHGFESRFVNAPDFTKEDRFEWVFRFSRYFMHQTLMLNLVAIISEMDGSGGGMQRLEARYDLSDRVDLLGGIVFYQSGDAPGFETIAHNDRLFLQADYRF